MINLKKGLLDVGIIVVSVLLATWLENVRQKWDEEETVKEFLIGLKADLQNDITEMKNDKLSYQKNHSGFSFYSSIQIGEKLNADSIEKYKNIFYSTTQLQPNSGGYEGFKSSGKLYSIENRELRSSILDLYQEVIPLLIGSTSEYTDRKRKLTAYFQENLKKDSKGEFNTQELILSPVVRNFCSSLKYTQEIQDRYDKTIQVSERIIQKIDSGVH